MRDILTFKKMVYQIYHILSRKQRIRMVGVFFAIFIGSVFELLGVSSILPFIQAILQPERLYEYSFVRVFADVFHASGSNGIIMLTGIGIVIVFIVKNLYLALSAYIQASYNSRMQKELSILMLRSYMARSYGFFVENGTDVIMRGVQNDINCVYLVVQNGFKLLAEMLVVVMVTIYLMSADTVLTLGVIAIGVVCMLLVVFGLKKNISRMSSLMRKANINQYKWITQITGGIKDILVYDRKDYFINSYEEAADDSCKSSKYYTFASALPERVIESFCVSGIIVAVIIRMFLGVETVSFVPKLAVFAMGAFRLLPSISRSTGYLNTFVYYREWVESAYENIVEARKVDQENKINDAVPSTEINENYDGFLSDISIDKVCWRYPNSDKRVLDGVTIQVYKGQTIGIIGESGSGKSTLSDLLLRLYQPEQGDIRMDRTNIATIPHIWSRTIGYVPQSVFLVDGSIRENVIFGADNPNDDKVWEALKKASLFDFVKSQPDGLDTMVGERGVKLSGGQRQRIAIARALYANPQILVLDEATSALDGETENAVMNEIDSLSGTITMIIIAHRLTTLKNCDRIFEIVDGKAIERDKNEVIHNN